MRLLTSRNVSTVLAPLAAAALSVVGSLSAVSFAQPAGTYRPSGNNGFGNGYQVAPGNSGPRNNANNATPARTNPSNSPNRNN